MRNLAANAVNRLIRHLSRYGKAVRAAALIRNQTNALIGYHLAESPHPEDNGELWLLDHLAGHVECFIDVGANRGAWSELLLSRTSARGIAIEPGAQAVARLRSSRHERLTVIQAAVGDVAGGEAMFYEEPDAGEMSSITVVHSREAVARQVPVVTIDSLIADAGWDRVDLIKIDAEGWDFHCLRGAHHALSTQQIKVVQFEYNHSWADAGSTLKAALDYLEGHGYEVAALRPDGLMTYHYHQFGEFFRYSNFVAFLPVALAWLG